MEFTAIETQEAFDAAIKDRLERERKTFTEKLNGYETIKKEAEDAKSTIETLKSQIEEAKTKISGFETEKETLTAKIQGYESDSVKTRIALEMGLPYEFAGRLTGSSEEEIRKDAESMSKLVGTQSPPPLKNTETNNDDSETAAYKSLLNGTKGED